MSDGATFVAPSGDAAPPSIAAACDWFAARGQQPFAFQREAWQAWLDGESGLINAATGRIHASAWVIPVRTV
jgi:ATP-dependent Lhr-like helicase